MQSILVLLPEKADHRGLIQAGQAIAASEGRPLRVVGIQPRKALHRGNGAALERLFSYARGAGAELTVFYNDDPVSTAIQYIQRNGICQWITALPACEADNERIRCIRAAHPAIPLRMMDERGITKANRAVLPAGTFSSRPVIGYSPS